LNRFGSCDHGPCQKGFSLTLNRAQAIYTENGLSVQPLPIVPVGENLAEKVTVGPDPADHADKIL